MKITKSKLKEIIKEELQKVMEVDDERAIMRAAARRAAMRYQKGTGRGGVKPASSRKMPELPPKEKADDRLLNDASLFARILLGNGYSVELFDRSWRGSADSDALLDATRYINDYDRSGDWNEIKAKAEEVIKRVSNEFVDRVDSDEEFKARLSGSYNAEYMKELAAKNATRGLQSTY
tara:strand:- start:3557 stop:4090 length:534 start_codon:yes stop_codon:yes gene_type:complete